jgi:hypothetical protein
MAAVKSARSWYSIAGIMATRVAESSPERFDPFSVGVAVPTGLSTQWLTPVEQSPLESAPGYLKNFNCQLEGIDESFLESHSGVLITVALRCDRVLPAVLMGRSDDGGVNAVHPRDCRRHARCDGAKCADDI